MTEMGQIHDFLPTAEIQTLRFRAQVLAAIRQYFDQRGFFEVDTPLLSNDQVIDANLQPFVVSNAFQGQDLYLQTSPEFAMKRLLVAGVEKIYQLDKVFRRGERGGRHNPEFTMVEWYAVGTDHHQQLQVTEDLVRHVFTLSTVKTLPSPPFVRTTYADAFRRHVGIDVFATETSEFPRIARERGVVVPESMESDDRDEWLNLLLAELVEPQLGRDTPEFLLDYPASQAALARVRTVTLPWQIGRSVATYDVAERFELYVEGIELCNGYHELTDPAELRQRIHREWTNRAGAPPVHSRLLQAMELGLPPCSGVALGVDRLVMLAAGKTRIEDVIAFPIERA